MLKTKNGENYQVVSTFSENTKIRLHLTANQNQTISTHDFIVPFTASHRRTIRGDSGFLPQKKNGQNSNIPGKGPSLTISRCLQGQ